jgi:F-type H+-transporting ATPase subunit epsilon
MAEAGQNSAMTTDFLLEVVTPVRQVVAERVDSVRAPGSLGEFGVLPSHERLITSLDTGMLRYRTVGTGEWTELAVSAGLVEVLPDRVIVLAQIAETAQDIDIVRAEAALQRARDRLKNPEDATDVDRALEALKRSTMRLEAARGNTKQN